MLLFSLKNSEQLVELSTPSFARFIMNYQDFFKKILFSLGKIFNFRHEQRKD
jgi:hypothetical protein